ncbi:hypothetical protein O2K51_06760 [Apibacter raozihei]|uniref:hypothetical protein n=1 Tax=Apibacter raozihei TaxID=2500547 RepID=UPI000FE3620D|nr:hypothetical protein [Apibacter raozihei]
MNTIQNKYYFQALDNFPYNMEETIEALNYALSYEKNADCLCLLARVYSEILNDYETAKEYFEEAMSINIHSLNLYPYFIDCLLWNDDYKEAKKLINFALTVKGIDKAVILNKKSLLLEYQKKYKKALNMINNARLHTYNSNFMTYLESREKQIKLKKKSNEKSK